MSEGWSIWKSNNHSHAHMGEGIAALPIPLKVGKAGRYLPTYLINPTTVYLLALPHLVGLCLVGSQLPMEPYHLHTVGGPFPHSCSLNSPMIISGRT